VSSRRERYIPAAGHDWLLPLYDPVLRLFFREEQAKRELLAQADVRTGQRVLDVGCGTGTLAILIKAECPQTHVVGLDGDPKALAIARRKAARAGVDVAFDEGLASSLPYSDGSFERVFSSLVLHHLSREHKQRSLSEILRVLTPGGTFHLLDFGRPVTAWERGLARLFFRSPEVRDNVQGGLAALLREAGFADVEELARRGTIVGSVWYYRAARPAERGASAD
jgi:SAM-dependent methyltransferase